MVVAPPLPANLQTPCLVVDRDVLEANLVTMAVHARDHGVALRPHAKTHNCLEIARRQLFERWFNRPLNDQLDALRCRDDQLPAVAVVDMTTFLPFLTV